MIGACAGWGWGKAHLYVSDSCICILYLTSPPPLQKIFGSNLTLQAREARGAAQNQWTSLGEVHWKNPNLDLVATTVRGRGLEPPRPCEHYHLKVACLPVSTPAHLYQLAHYIQHFRYLQMFTHFSLPRQRWRPRRRSPAPLPSRQFSSHPKH